MEAQPVDELLIEQPRTGGLFHPLVPFASPADVHPHEHSPQGKGGPPSIAFLIAIQPPISCCHVHKLLVGLLLR
jgi:hypothetical protein